MEPSSVEDGNLHQLADDDQRACPLQWSRPQLRTETDIAVGAVRCHSVLQWSRPQLRTETGELVCGHMQAMPASMEPSSVEDGNVED